MTIQEALDRIDMVKPNMVPAELKLRWLSEIDDVIYREIVTQHHETKGRPWHHHEHHWPGDPLEQAPFPPPEEKKPEELHPYSMDDSSVKLLVPFPYDKMYQHYLAMQIDIMTAEIEKYNNDSQLFNAAYMEYSDWYTRSHYPKSRVHEFRL